MELFIQATVFNPELQGKAVRIKGYSEDGDYFNEVVLVSKVEFDSMEVINYKGNYYLLTDGDFNVESGIKLTVLKE